MFSWGDIFVTRNLTLGNKGDLLFSDIFIYLLFLFQDIERNDGSSEKPYYMSKDLKKILDLKNEQPRDSSATSH